MMPVYEAYETYFRGEGDLLVETGKHVLLPGGARRRHGADVEVPPRRT